MSLPQELLDAIVDAVDDPDDLKSCSLAFTAFVSPAQRIILRKIVIRQGGRRVLQGNTLSIDKVYTTLQRSPHIARHVRDVTIQFAGLPLNDGERGPLKYILGALHSIERFKLLGSGSSAGSQLVELLPNFLLILRLPTLARVSLSHIVDVPSELLALALISAQVVLLDHIGRILKTPDFANEVLVSTHHPRLEHLAIRGAAPPTAPFDFVLAHGTPRYMERLSTVELAIMGGLPTAAHALIAAASPTLENLFIDYGHCYRFRSNIGLSLPKLHGLRTIKLSLALGWVRRLPLDLFATVAALPDAVPHIQRLTLVFILDSLEQNVPWQESGVFALFGTHPEYKVCLPHLRHVDCVLAFGPTESNPRAVQDRVFVEFAVNMEGRFPGLRGTQILGLSRTVESEVEL
ncbi:hypothetical protein C8R46DRAFT_1095641 [Mycena filopes]|nr:hypothetical protein C8R46DRAFT_1095641 [Mycena filopes]